MNSILSLVTVIWAPTYDKMFDYASLQQCPPERSVGHKQWWQYSDTPSQERIHRPLTGTGGNSALFPPHHDMPAVKQCKGACVEVIKVVAEQKITLTPVCICYLEDCSVYDEAHCLSIMTFLGEGGACVGWSSSRQKTVFCGEFLCKWGYIVLYVSIWSNEVIMWSPCHCSTQTTHLHIYMFHKNLHIISSCYLFIITIIWIFFFHF